MHKRMNLHRLADAKRLSREGGNLQIYSTNLLRIYLKPALAEQDFFEPLITQITLIFNKLQILRIYTD